MNKKFRSRRPVTYSKEYIEWLRENVKRTCNYLNKGKMKFDFDRTRETQAYAELDALLAAEGYPEIDRITMHRFFNEEFILDDAGEPVITFREKTESIFSDFVTKYLPLRGATPFEGNSEALDSNISRLDDSIKAILYHSFMKSKSTASSVERIIVDDYCNCTITKRRYQKALTDISHIMLGCHMDKPGSVKIVSAVDLDKGKQLKAFSYRLTSIEHTFFFIFPEIKHQDTFFRYEITTHVENYIADLIDKGTCVRSVRPWGPISYDRVEEEWLFPDTQKFAELKCKIDEHPNHELIGLTVQPQIIEGFKSFKINHGDLSFSQTRVVIRFTL